MPYQPGQSGNPTGRPPNPRALSRLIEKALNRTVPLGDKRIARKRVMANLLAEAVSTGKVTFPDGREMVFHPDEWESLVFRLLTHVEGSAPVDVNVRGSLLLIWDIPVPHPDESQS